MNIISPNKKTRKALERENYKRPIALTPVPREQWPENGHNHKRTHVWISRSYLVQEYYEGEGVVRLSVCRTTLNKSGRFHDGITWDEQQDIKRKIGYGESYAIEIYPRDRDVVNVANMRHLWVLPAPLQIGWFK